MAAVKKYPAELYAEQVRSGEILVCEYVRLAVERYYADLDRALDKGWYFDKRAAMRTIHFIEKLKHTKGEWAGQRFRLEPWQQFVLWNIFGWKNADGTRRFRYAYIEIARKNGKTALSAGIGLYMLFADGESRPEVYSAATVKDQAKICFSDAVEIVKATDLKNYLTPYRNSIVYELKGGTMKPLSSDYGTHDGLNPSCGIIDEFHAHKDSGMFDVIKSAFGARRQPLMFIITTAGFDKSGVCYAYRENVIKVLRGVNEDDSLFGIIYTLDDKSEWDDPKMWIKANPNLGVSLSADYLADQVKDAKNRPEAVRNVMTKNVDLWVDAERTWILDDVWLKCIGTTDPADLKGCACWGGLDLSNVSDITAYVLLFHENDRFQLLPHFWIPEDAGKGPQGEYQLRQVGGRGLCNRYAGQCYRLRLRQGGYSAYRGRLRLADIGLRPLELFADDHRLAERGDGVQPLRTGLRLDVGTDQGVRETGADREDRTLRQSGPAMDARIDARQERSCGQHQTRQGEIDAEDRRHRSLDHGTRRVDDRTG